MLRAGADGATDARSLSDSEAAAADAATHPK